MTSIKQYVTVVVCTFNRADMLCDTLRSMLTLRTDNEFTYDIVVVDNGSTDNTQEVLGIAAGEATVPLRNCVETKPGVAAARNRGLAEARGPWVAFCDDDQQVDADWLFELMQMAGEKSLKIVGGAVRLRLPDGAGEVALPLRRNFGESIENRPHAYSASVTPGTGNLLLHCDVIDRVGNFDESLREAGEDTDLYRRIRAAGYEAWFNPRAIVWHSIPAYRLTAAYQQWSSRRTGWVFADRDRREHGLVKTLVRAAARGAQMALARYPRLLWTTVTGRPAEALGIRCDLWRSEAYVRCALARLSPNWLGQQTYQKTLEFRNEREAFASVTSSPSQQPLAAPAESY